MNYNGMLFVDRLLEVAKHKTGTRQTQGKIADQIGVEPKTISGWRNGVKPNAESLLKIAETYHCSVDYLLGIDKAQLNEPHSLRNLLRNTFLYHMRDSCPVKMMFDTDYKHNESSICFFEIEENPKFKVYSAISEYQHTFMAFQYLNEEQCIKLIDGILDKYISAVDE